VAAGGSLIRIITVVTTVLGGLTVTTVSPRARTVGRSLLLSRGVVDGLRSRTGPRVATVLRALILIIVVAVGLRRRLGGLGPGAAAVAGSLVATTISRVGRGRGLVTTAISRVGWSRSLVATTISRVGWGRGLTVTTTVSAVGRSRATAADGEASSVDAAATGDVLGVTTSHVAGGLVLADKHVLAVVTASNVGGIPPDTLREVTGAFREASGVLRALIEPLLENHLPHVAPSVPRKIFSVAVVARVLHVASDMVGPSLSGLSELVVPSKRWHTVGLATVVVSLEASGLDILANWGAVAGVSSGAAATAAPHGALGHGLTAHFGVSVDASGENGESNRGGLHVD
jgi:hypothetical protein